MTKERNDTMTNYAVILSGGVGTRMKMGSFPKQYLEVKKKPILIYTLECFQETPEIDLNEAEKILDEDHYGLKKVKERIFCLLI